MQAVTLNGISLHYRWSPAPAAEQTIVFVNSLGTDFRIWDGAATGIGGRASILVYDKRGHGLSDLGPVPHAMADHVGDLEALMDHMGLGPSIICGLSAGGIIALGLVARRPDLVTALVLCGTAPKVGTEESWNERIGAVTRHGLDQIADAVLARWFTGAFREDGNPGFAMARNMLLRQSPAGYTATCAAIRDTDYTAVAAGLRLPVLCMVGAEDGATPPALVEAMAGIIRGSRFHVLDGCGHMPCIERPERVTALILAFMDQIEDGAAGVVSS